MLKNSFEIYQFLKNKNLLEDSPKYWWPSVGTFEVIVGAILTQNTTWKNVEKSFKNLDGFLELDTFLTLKENSLKEMIKPSGFYNQKAPRILKLAKNIKDKFSDFKTFQNQVTREWLLSQKGIGKESADAILCYACFRDEMVVDTYTKRLLKTFDIEFSDYDKYKEFLESGIKENLQMDDLNLVFSRFHGMIVEFNKLQSLK
ncbi:MAG: 3-methyladenine DNA glycosylase [Sulfurimonas sp.]|nr:3-methyladenine DNA glycosylase [Sulfurimonas sp.]